MYVGRPEYISREVFRAYLSRNGLNEHCSVDGVLASTFVVRCERAGRPIPSVEDIGQRKWRLIDVWARAKAECVEFCQPLEKKIMGNIYELKEQLADLEKQIGDSKHRLEAQRMAEDLLGTRLLAEHEIVAGAAETVGAHCGIYFLIKGKRVVYVGQSVSILSRIANHLETKDFDEFAWIRVPRKQLDLVETLYIQHLRPALNGNTGPMAWKAVCELAGVI